MASDEQGDLFDQVTVRPAAARARRTLSDGVLAFRWVGLTWMVALNIARPASFRHPIPAWAGLGAAVLWTIWLTLNRDRSDRFLRYLDLALSMGLILISIWVVPRASGGLFYATAYPSSTALWWGATGGIPAALVSAAALEAALVVGRQIGGVSLLHLTLNDRLSLVNGAVNFLLAGLAAGVVSRHLDRSMGQLLSVLDKAEGERERAAAAEGRVAADREAIVAGVRTDVLPKLDEIRGIAATLAARPSLQGNELEPLVQTVGKARDRLSSVVETSPDGDQTGDRIWLTFLFTDIVDSTGIANRLGDRHWQELLRRNNLLARAEFSRFRGQVLDNPGDGFLVSFDVPSSAISCAFELERSVRRLGLPIRAGIHAGECQRLDGQPSGIALHITHRIMDLARGGGILVSSAVRDAVVGSQIRFVDRGEHALRGVPGMWRLFAVQDPAAAT